LNDVATATRTPLPLRPGISDLGFALLLVLGSVVAVRLEPAHAYFWRVVPLTAAGTLFLAAVLLAVRSPIGTALASAVHITLVISFTLVLLISVFLLITIYFSGTGLVLFPGALVLLANSIFTLIRIRSTKRPPRLPQARPLHPTS